MSEKNKKESKKVNTNKKEKSMGRRLSTFIICLMWGGFISVVLLSALVFFFISKGKIGYMPPIEDMENPIDKYASQVISSDDKLLGTYSYSKENRVYVNYSEISPYLTKALVATEDVRYYDHSGVDFLALGRVFVKTFILRQKQSGGGSTISQQLAKLLYSPKTDNIYQRGIQKPVEWVIATKLERYYTKDEIINLYLNKYDFNYNAVGIKSASQTYFDKLPIDLTIEESALLIGMCKNSSYFNPVRRPEVSLKRRNTVLEQMYKHEDITKSELDSLKQLPLGINFKRTSHNAGLAPYFRQFLAKRMMANKPDKKKYAAWQKQQYKEDSASWLNDPLYGWCNKNFKANGNPYNIYTDGLKIFTSIDSRMQKYGEEAVAEHIGEYLQPAFTKEKRRRSYAPFSKDLSPEEIESVMVRSMKQTDRYKGLKKEGLSDEEIKTFFKSEKKDMKVFSWQGEIDTLMTPWDSIRYHKGMLCTGFMSMDPRSGQVKAYVGGTDFKFFKYDMVSLGKRQIGSTIKPFLYTLAMEEGMTPCDEMLHVEQELITETGVLWRPRNANKHRIGEMVQIRWGLQNSSNWVTAYLMKQFSPYAFARLLYSFGLKNEIDPVVSLCLGICDASVEEMVSGYTSFPNKGVRVEPLYVLRIEDSHGNVISQLAPQMKEVFSERTSYKMLDMLRAVADGGTGSRIRHRYNIRAQMGAKTGTSQNHSDGWFIGFTPTLVSGCWVGGEDRGVHFDNIAMGQGANMALPIFGLFMQKVYADETLPYKTDAEFEVPEKYQNVCNKNFDMEDEEGHDLDSGIDSMFD